MIPSKGVRHFVRILSVLAWTSLVLGCVTAAGAAAFHSQTPNGLEFSIGRLLIGMTIFVTLQTSAWSIVKYWQLEKRDDGLIRLTDLFQLRGRNKHIADDLAMRGHGPEGLGGWLILPMVWLLLDGLMSIRNSLRLFFMLEGRLWQVLTAPGSSAYIQSLEPFIWSKALFTLAVGVAGLYIFRLFLKRDYKSGRLYLAWLWIKLAGTLAASYFSSLVFQSPNDETFTESTLLVVTANLAWTVYFHRSVRVRNTFNRGRLGALADRKSSSPVEVWGDSGR